ncbi:MAG: hypothetical protein A2831_00420 [Candidatus Yanofskybacteria bacterium RIFCSPHIGHO2_01_FULL_44_17]|uniref:Uncharacterized protein n=1 Tax=Candidatus Yanofskybacteria bacterium RIFCSPHIGHO2_01_FULL_44_17 TaxID=1802668 RepID=A0A1F8EXN8_9BACT|nr:MAG: hypothetical protein A2831_00420 [Candidatus Yanofskybacteria bacterium RIFCSPHIGHO2_01_FULL_44_17]
MNEYWNLGVGPAQKFEKALNRNGCTPAELDTLSSGSLLSQVRRVIAGQAKIVPVEPQMDRWVTINSTTIAVNLGATPRLPFDGARVESHIGNGWAIVERRADGLYVNDHKVILHLSKRQIVGSKFVRGYELRRELTGKPVLNANILDALYDNPHLIPEDWKKDEHDNIRYIFFWGSIYCDVDGRLCVRALCFRSSAWGRSCNWLVDDWLGPDLAASLASV